MTIRKRILLGLLLLIGASQHQLLRDQLTELQLGSDCGLLLVHGLNPLGFSALRRVNES